MYGTYLLQDPSLQLHVSALCWPGPAPDPHLKLIDPDLGTTYLTHILQHTIPWVAYTVKSTVRVPGTVPKLRFWTRRPKRCIP
jgi:hypothetical protein